MHWTDWDGAHADEAVVPWSCPWRSEKPSALQIILDQRLSQALLE